MPGVGGADEEYRITYALVRPTASECVYMDSIEGAVEKKRIQGGAKAELSEAEVEEVRQQMLDAAGRITCCISAAIPFCDLQ